MSALTSFDDLVAFLDANKFPHKLDRAGQVVELPTNDPNLPGNLYLRWDKQLPFIQLIQFVIHDVPAARIADLCRAIVMLNNKIEFPGFGFDDENRRLYNRTVVPVVPSIDPMLLNRLGQGCVKQAQAFAPAFKAVVGGKAGTDILALGAEAISNMRSRVS